MSTATSSLGRRKPAARVPGVRASSTTGHTNRALAVFVAILVVAVLGIGGHYVLHRRHDELAAARADRVQAAAYEAKAVLGRQVEAHATSYERRLSTGKALFPTRRDQAEIIDDLVSLATRTGVSWPDASEQQASASTVPGPSGGGLTPYTVSLSVQGSLSQILAFVSGVGHMSRAATASGLSLTWQGSKSKTAPSVVKADLTVIAWSAGGAPTAPTPTGTVAP